MKTLVGLGNSGDKYKNNRHNVGHMLVDYINEQIRNSKFEIRNKEKISNLKLLKTDCFMNASGKFIKQHVPSSMLQVLYVVHDDLDIPLGKCKVQFGTGPKLHNGILSVEEELGTNDFWRIRIGIDNPSTRPPLARLRSGQNKISGEDFVLQDFTDEELKQLQPVFEKVYKQITQ